MPFFKQSLAGPGYIVLNTIRVCNIICLLSVVAAAFVMLVKTFVVSKFFFFDGVSHVITAFLAMGLIITELPLFRRYIANNWPLLSPASGFVTLGVVMLILGVTLLGNLNKEATSQESLGTPMWRIVIAGGIITCIFGITNIFASYMFRQKAIGITARQVRAHGARAPEKTTPYISPAPSTLPSQRRARSFQLRRSNTENVLPSYHTNAATQQTRNISAPNGLGMGGYYGEKGPEDVGGEDVSGGREGGVHLPPVVGNVQRPDLAHHPAYNVRRPASSVYTRMSEMVPPRSVT